MPQVVEAVGYWFIPYVLTTEYGRVLTMVGKSFGECLKNVNAMHGHIRIAHFSQMNMPIIRTVFEVRHAHHFPEDSSCLICLSCLFFLTT